MAGGDSADESQLKGLAKYFNSQTSRGRANVSILLLIKHLIRKYKMRSQANQFILIKD